VMNREAEAIGLSVALTASASVLYSTRCARRFLFAASAFAAAARASGGVIMTTMMNARIGALFN
jgi:hypothetical protein